MISKEFPTIVSIILIEKPISLFRDIVKQTMLKTMTIRNLGQAIFLRSHMGQSFGLIEDKVALLILQ